MITPTMEWGKVPFSEFAAGGIYYFTDYSITCHICGKTISPLRAYIIPVDFYFMLRGTSVRAVVVKLHPHDTLFLCPCLQKGLMVTNDGWFSSNFTCELPEHLSKTDIIPEEKLDTNEFLDRLGFSSTIAFWMAKGIICNESEDEWRYC